MDKFRENVSLTVERIAATRHPDFRQVDSLIENGRDSEKPGLLARRGVRRGKGRTMNPPTNQSGYLALSAARKLVPDADEWLPLMRDVLQLPLWMLPAVQRVLKTGTGDSCQ